MTKDGHNRVVAAVAPRILQVLSVLLMAFWYSRYLGGFGLYRDGRVDGTAIFCWHPLFMTIAYLVCVAEAIQAFKAPPYNKIARSTQKTFHWVFHVIAMILTGVSLAAVFISHRINRRMDMYSVHSWVGIFTVGFTNLQGTVGLLAFLSPATGSVLREALLPYHKCCGVVTFLLGCVSILLGIQEQTAFIQAFQRPGLRDGVMQVPIVLSLVVTVAAVWVSYNHLVVWTAPEPQICAGRLDDQSDVEGLLLQAEDSTELERPSISLPVKGPSMNIES